MARTVSAGHLEKEAAVGALKKPPGEGGQSQKVPKQRGSYRISDKRTHLWGCGAGSEEIRQYLFISSATFVSIPLRREPF